MTEIRYSNPPRWRQSATAVRYRGQRVLPLVVALEPNGLLIRCKGTRQALRLPFAAAWLHACIAEAERLRREKKERRRAALAGGVV